ncbi:uncharacterized protein LOC143584123 [Bidens hawaiensis]|uniref:uncharacterized protein LOC143584123 n=1 Tax=Bidens hawaiensis TaxID=980011 RepID=UPI0040494390
MSDDITRNTEIFVGNVGDNVPDETLCQLLLEEKNYNREHLLQQHHEYLQKLHPQQHDVYDYVLSASISNTQVLVFVYAHGGTGKTFLWTTITSYIRSQGKTVLTVAASGIASLLLPNGRTAHPRFKIPIDLTDESNCNISKNSYLSELLIETELIIWDETPMSARKYFEALDRTLKDILNNSQQSFGGKSILLGGDFRQTLPVKKRSNMTSGVAAEIQNFSNWLLCIGDGLSGVPDAQENENSRVIEIPSKFSIPNNVESISKLIHFLYDENSLIHLTPSDLAQKAIVCPKNDIDDHINQIILNMLPGEATTYSSTDVVVPHANDNTDIETIYPVEYLNTIKYSGFPAHNLQLKVKVPIILL